MKDGCVRLSRGGEQGVGRSESSYGVAAAKELSSSIYEKSHTNVLTDILTTDSVS